MLCINLSAQEALPRYPTIDQVASYLRAHLEEPPSGFINYFWVDDEPLLYADLNGDGEDDLIARGWLFVAIMLWEGDGYGKPLQLIETAPPNNGAWSHVELYDWTLDDLPEIMFERREPINAPEITGHRYYRTIISCELLCYVAWEGEIAEFVAVEAQAGMYLSETDMMVSRNDDNRVVLDVIQRDFAFNCVHRACTVIGDIIEDDGFQAQSRIGAVVRTRYVWDGLEFLRQNSTLLIESQVLPPTTQLSTISTTRIEARITYDADCQLWLDDIAIDSPFDCVVDFTRVYWRGDFLFLEFAYFTDETLVIYDADGNELQRVTGAIQDQGLFGVRLDGDNILSAGGRYSAECPDNLCWFSLNDTTDIYQFELE